MTDLKLRLEQRKVKILKEIETAAKDAESERLQTLVSDLRKVEALLAQYETLVAEAELVLGDADSKEARTFLGKGLEMMLRADENGDPV